jgi:predicted transcriptional regulator
MSDKGRPDIPVFRPREDGLEKTLGALEAQIMDVVWSAEEPICVQEVRDELARTGKEAAYTTVMTTLSRLSKKGFLGREMRGKAYYYFATVSEEELGNTVTKQVVDGLMSTFAEPAISYFVEALSEKAPSKLDELADLIEQKKRDEEDGDARDRD